jgi:hypothetical protein
MKYSLRSLMALSLLWVTVVVALAVGWWVDHRQMQQLKVEVGGAKYSMALARIFEDILRDQGYAVDLKFSGDITVKKRGAADYHANLFVYMKTERLPPNLSAPAQNPPKP